MAQAVYEEVAAKYQRVAVEGRQPKMFAAMVAEQIGLCDENGDHYTRPDGAPRLAEKPKRKASDFDIALLAEAMIGRDWKNVLGLGNSSSVFPVRQWKQEHARLLQEEAAAPIGPSVWANVAAWSATVGGLLKASFLEGYQQAAFDLVDLFPVRPVVFWQGGERYIDIIGPYMPAQKIGPGESHPDMSMSALWVEPGPMAKYGGKVLVLKETAYIDISGGQLLSKAKTGGESLKFREQELVLDVIVGSTNNWKLGMLTDAAATAYNTYGPTITNPAGTSRTIPNDIVNPLNDVGAFQKSDEQLANLYHPVTDNPIDVMQDVVILPTVLAKWAQWLMGVGDLDGWNQSTVGPAQAAPGTFPNSALKGKNPWQNALRPVVSRWLHQRHTASTTQPDPNRTAGLGLSGSAIYRWYRMNPAQFACRRQAWPADTLDLSPTEYVMADQGIIAGQIFNIATQVQVLNPYAIQRNKGV